MSLLQLLHTLFSIHGAVSLESVVFAASILAVAVAASTCAVSLKAAVPRLHLLWLNLQRRRFALGITLPLTAFAFAKQTTILVTFIISHFHSERE